MTRYRARWLYPGDSPPLANATIEVAGPHIREISNRSDLDIDLGNVVLLPGLINCHTHLEFSTLAEPLQPLTEFADWVQSVISWRHSQPQNPITAIQQGLGESIQSGVTSLGEIATQDWRKSWSADHSSAPRQIVMFREYLGLAEDRVELSLQNAHEFLEFTSDSDVQPALSPHAPYSVHSDLLSGLCKLAEEKSVPLAFHLAESIPELQYCQSQSGPIAEMLSRLGVIRSDRPFEPTTPLDYLKALNVRVPVLIIHGNYLNNAEISYIAARKNMSVIYCPRTHHAMQSDSHPWRKMLAQGINVALGTDGRCSNPDLSVWNELKFLQQHAPDLPASQLIQLATRNAAHALGLSQTGSLKPGNIADLCVIPLSASARENPELFLLREDNPPIAVMQAGKWVIPPPNVPVV